MPILRSLAEVSAGIHPLYTYTKDTYEIALDRRRCSLLAQRRGVANAGVRHRRPYTPRRRFHADVFLWYVAPVQYQDNRQLHRISFSRREWEGLSDRRRRRHAEDV